ncbi:MFS transporter [Macrococcus sp. DPC7161]|uniref:CynX/NimT family MFS transporter n=1 Tax=Macrococcus sp. DPC7161 TaxID=2507060 RepID=UPI00100BD2AF|nr:MFS transporter [Macrococcus sp. DPC7161]RXK18194.1 MFS transporter [Macrococcus sp. DPC7161]
MFKKKEVLLLILGIIFVSSTLRAPITSVGPVIDQIGSRLNLSSTLLGSLTTIPLLMFALISPSVAGVSAKFGMSKTLFCSTIVLLIGLLIRVIPNPLFLFLGTVLIGIGIAFGNVIFPSFIKWRFPSQMGVMTGIYTLMMTMFGGVGSGFSVPLSHVGHGGYQFALGFWVILCIFALIVWLPQLKTNPKIVVEKSDRKIYKSKLAVCVALMMGFQSMLFFCMATWIPSILMSYGFSKQTAGYFMMLSIFSQLPMNFIVPVIASKLKDQRILAYAYTLLFIIGFSLLFTQTFVLTIIAMIILGLASGSAFSLCMLTFSLRAKTTQDAIELSGFSQGLGYLVAATGPVLFGWLKDYTGHFESCIFAFLIVTVIFFVFSYISCKNRYIFD